MTYKEHLQWCKDRALEYVDQGDLASAVASMGSDITKHEQGMSSTAPAYLTLMALGMMHVANGDTREVRRWIEGFR
jgi:hypothetical protein